MGRHWPDGRGVFHNKGENLFVWVGEEDHLRIVSMQGSRDKPSEEGKDIKEVTTRFIRACDEVQKVLKAEGADFMHNDHLGWVHMPIKPWHRPSCRNHGDAPKGLCHGVLQKALLSHGTSDAWHGRC